ncbi:protein IQ-DOMAIN 20 [Salvia hispanica]|uniref:protein IQ-DOMAIN 20 n=1 Tax=Salvia hispanica TaxID=49212 RepID=UPI00200970A3|nr:protein IQ-DOMAIN 20 [Salvia hispanica]
MLQSKDHTWWRAIPRKLFRSSPSRRHPNNTNNGNFSQELNSSPQEVNAGSDFLSKEDMAAIAIQSCFRGHLARRAYKALRSLVKLQALVRGVLARRQARIALDCMHALARLQITVRARQLLLNT